jgi:hypothetical protein
VRLTGTSSTTVTSADAMRWGQYRPVNGSGSSELSPSARMTMVSNSQLLPATGFHGSVSTLGLANTTLPPTWSRKRMV